MRKSAWQNLDRNVIPRRITFLSKFCQADFLALALILALPAVHAAGPAAQTRPVFRTTVDAIPVHVTVRDGRRPVANLTSGDFELLDNGVPQEPRLFSLDVTPIDLTVVIDTSGSIGARGLSQVRRDVADLTGLLRPEDRIRAITFASTVTELLPMQNASLGAAGMLPADSVGATAFYHALIVSLLAESDPQRPHLVVAMTDGGDNVSLLGPDDVRDVAQRSEAVLHLSMRGLPRTRAVGWMPFAGAADVPALVAAAAATGGAVSMSHPASSARDVFKRVVDEFRTGYMLWFTPRGVPSGGWHDLTVRVTSGDYTVRARPGYFGAVR
jgi:hypothetical protein